MSVFPKFIIETDSELGDCLIIAKCTYHKQLVTDPTKVKGGGWWTMDQETMTITLHGESHDFGMAKLEDIAECVKSNRVFRSPTLMLPHSHEFQYQYRTQSGELIELPTKK
jgi:hypothetical protein